MIDSKKYFERILNLNLPDFLVHSYMTSLPQKVQVECKYDEKLQRLECKLEDSLFVFEKNFVQEVESFDAVNVLILNYILTHIFEKILSATHWAMISYQRVRCKTRKFPIDIPFSFLNNVLFEKWKDCSISYGYSISIFEKSFVREIKRFPMDIPFLFLRKVLFEKLKATTTMQWTFWLQLQYSNKCFDNNNINNDNSHYNNNI